MQSQLPKQEGVAAASSSGGWGLVVCGGYHSEQSSADEEHTHKVNTDCRQAMHILHVH